MMPALARSPHWWSATAIGIAASLVALAFQQGVRMAWQVRSLPERVMEWLLVFVPLDLFERGLQQFGANAKDLALAGTLVGMAILLIAVGTLTVRTVSSGWLAVLVGFGLWLFVMVIVMPVTGAGLFATGLLVSPALTDASYLCVFGGYSAVLALGTDLVKQLDRVRPGQPRGAASRERRSLLAGLAGMLATAAAYGAARAAAGSGGVIQSSLPLASPPTSIPTPTDAATATPLAAVGGVAGAATPSATATPSVPPGPTAAPAGFPTPPPAPALARDQEGSLTAARRPPGTLAPAITSNQDFYIVTKNAVADPVVDPNGWRLIIDGEVEHPVQVDYATLRALPVVEIPKTLECISNLTAGCNMASFGCDLISTAVWRGARLSDVLNLAGGLRSNVVTVAFLAMDEFSSALPPEAVLDPEALIVYEMNGQVLPREHGYPARLLVPGRYGMKNPKWLAGIRALNQPYVDWYQQRGWTKDGIVKTMSRIDVPADAARLASGRQRVAGIAYAGDRGIRLVEVSTDGGTTWQPASLVEPAPGKDAMVRFEASFRMADTPVMLVVRATDGAGVVQPDDFGLPAPDGGWGQDSIQVTPA
jgi:DMSO/TMAO reductase YedYZ molybdopterin-dependent catalytic subunit